MQSGRPKYLESAADVFKYGIMYNDNIKFNGIGGIYKVTSTHMGALDDDNDYVFKELSIDKRTLCEALYKYQPGPGVWPEYHHEDYAACTRVVVALMALSELAIHEEHRHNKIAELIKQRDELNYKIDSLRYGLD